jgi:hypothetical protein
VAAGVLYEYLFMQRKHARYAPSETVWITGHALTHSCALAGAQAQGRTLHLGGQPHREEDPMSLLAHTNGWVVTWAIP